MKKEINQKIRVAVLSALCSARRPIETRRLVRRIVRRIKGASEPQVWGNISCLEKRGAFVFTVKKRGGKSYIAL